MKLKSIFIIFFNACFTLYGQNYVVNDQNAKLSSSSANISSGRDNISFDLLNFPFGGTTVPITINYTGTQHVI